MNSNYKGLYIHFPLCKRKCFYCDFYTEEYIQKKELDFYKYLKKEFSLRKCDKYIYDTIYFGGGSPSIMHPDIFKKTIDFLSDYFAEFSEISLEANPEDINLEKILLWKNLGINRISLGIQAVDKEILEKVGRRQSNLIEKINLVFKYFENINFDFILGLPGENIINIKKNIEIIEKYEPKHVSYYIYDNDHDSLLNKLIKEKRVKLISEELISKYHDFILSKLDKLGFVRYEISSWSKKGYECKHNLKYWNNYEYIGLGVSAGGHNENIRYVNCKNIEKYKIMINNKQEPIEEKKSNNQIDEIFEKLFMGLRLSIGVDLESFNFNGELIQLVVEMIHESMFEYIIEEDSFLRLNNKGFDQSNLVFLKLMDIYEKVLNIKGEYFG